MVSRSVGYQRSLGCHGLASRWVGYPQNVGYHGEPVGGVPAERGLRAKALCALSSWLALDSWANGDLGEAEWAGIVKYRNIDPPRQWHFGKMHPAFICWEGTVGPPFPHLKGQVM